MALRRKSPLADIDENDIEVGHPKKSAAGIPGVAVSMKRADREHGRRPVRRGPCSSSTRCDGFDCQGCAWPDPDPEHRHTAEFCENGAKAVAEEATTDHIRPDVLRARTASRTCASTPTTGSATRAGSCTRWCAAATRTHYEPITWDEAFELIGQTLRGAGRAPTRRSSTPRARPPTRRRSPTSCSPAPSAPTTCPDCSNMCHESTSVALAETIGIGKGSVSLEDVHEAELIVISGQNPGHQPPADADRTGEGEEERRQDPRDQPAARGRAAAVQEPADRHAG